jgi:hypothetical protein
MARGVLSSLDYTSEVCNMIKVKYILPHHCVSKEGQRKKEEPEKKEAKEIKEVVIHQDKGTKVACEDQKDD